MRNTPIGIPEGATLKDKGRRQHVRKLIDTPVRYTDRAGLSSGVIRDISLGGAFILTRRAFSLQQNPSVSFFPSNFEKTVWITGDIVRVTPEGIGVRFTSINEIQNAALASLASTE
jgi:Tfp pilus assembly protein PilZ